MRVVGSHLPMFDPDNGIDYRLHRQYGFSNCRRL